MLTKDGVFADLRAVPSRVKPRERRTGIPGMRRYLALVGLSLVMLPGCIEGDFSSGDAVHQTIHVAFALAPHAEVRITNISGFVNVIPWKRQTIDIVAHKRAGDRAELQRTTVDISHDGSPASFIEVRTRYLHEGFFFWGDSGANVDYTIHVPANIALHIGNVSGDVQASGIVGDVDVSEVSGDVELTRVDGDVRVHTVSGSVTASLTSMKDGRHADIEAVSGSLHLAIPPRSGAYVNADSISGSFESDFDVPTHERTVGVSASGRIGDGSGTIEMHTISGSMTLSKT